MTFARFAARQARAVFVARSFATSARVGGPRTLATPFASAVAHKPSPQEMSDHYNKFLDVYENDGSLVSTHNLTSRTVTHAPIEEILEAPVNAKAEAPSTSSDSTYSTSGNNVYFVDGREGKLSFA